MWQPRRRDERADSGEQIERLEYEGDGAVTPGLLQGVSELAVGHLIEPLLGDRWPAEIAAEALERKLGHAVGRRPRRAR